jgi:putative PEP-CTERM system histidine kinase
MMTFGAISYGIAAIGFFGLTLLLVTSWRGKKPGAWLIAACLFTAIWGAWLTVTAVNTRLPILTVYFAEALRNCAWILALTTLAGTIPRTIVNAARWACGAILIAPVALLIAAAHTNIMFDGEQLLSRVGLGSALLVLILIEQIYRNASPTARDGLKYLVIGVGVIFAYDLFLYSQTELLSEITADAWSTRGVANSLAVPLIAIAARRNGEWSLDVFVSRQVVFHTSAFMIIGAYLVVMAVGGFYVREVGGAWGRVGQIAFLAGAAVVLASLLSSNALRRHAQVFISKHFYRNKYDYRIEWLRFINTLSSGEEEDVRRTSIRAIAQIFGSPGGILLTLDESQRRFVPTAAWPIRIGAIPNLAHIAISEDLPAFLSRTRWIVDMEEYKRAPDIYGNIAIPDWLRESEHLRIVSPLLQLDRLVGFLVLYAPPAPFALTYEDRDLLKTVGRHVATHLAQHAADRKLAESRQFEAYNRLTAFMMHDLKNSVAQLNLIVANASRHKGNPEFIDDAIGTIANAADRMSRLIAQLAGRPAASMSGPVDLEQVALSAIRRCSSRAPLPLLHSENQKILVTADAERLITVIEHLIRNAQDATGGTGTVYLTLTQSADEAVLTVSDNGQGMDADFMRDRLFRPFDSTKGSKGMGIGAYQAREYVHSLSGHVEVQSSPGQGTAFSITLPLVEGASDARSERKAALT